MASLFDTSLAHKTGPDPILEIWKTGVGSCHKPPNLSPITAKLGYVGHRLYPSVAGYWRINTAWEPVAEW